MPDNNHGLTPIPLSEWVTGSIDSYNHIANKIIPISYRERDLFDKTTQEAVGKLMDNHFCIIKEDIKEIKESLILEPTGYPVEVYVIAYSNMGRRNKCHKIPCKKTKPLGNWCYDLSTDQFLVDCAGFQHLGRFSLGYKARMESVEGWSVDIPISLSIIEKRIAPKFKVDFEFFKNSYPEKENTYSFIQCSGVFNDQD